MALRDAPLTSGTRVPGSIVSALETSGALEAMADKAHKQDVAHAARTRSAREQARTQDQANAVEEESSSDRAPDKSATAPGQLAVDDRGNISWEWSDDPELQADDLLGKTARLRALAPGDLSIENEEFDSASVSRDPVPVRKKPPGYNPYDSGEPTKQRWKKKRDLREFSKWVALRKRFKNESGGKP